MKNSDSTMGEWMGGLGVGEQVCETDVEHRCRGTGMGDASRERIWEDRCGDRWKSGQVEGTCVKTGRNGRKTRTGEVGGGTGGGKDGTQEQAAASHAVPLHKWETEALSQNAAVCWKSLPNMLILFDQDLLLPSAGKPITVTMYPSPHVEG